MDTTSSGEEKSSDASSTPDEETQRIIDEWSNPWFPEIAKYKDGKAVKTLKTYIEKGFICDPGRENGKFFPPDLLMRLLRLRDITKLVMELGLSNDEQTGNKSLAKKLAGMEGPGFRKVLALLLLIEEPHAIRHFLEQNINDSHLPLSKEYMTSRNIFGLGECGSGKRQNFFENQWMFIFPEPKASHYELEENHVLPWFIEEKNVTKLKANDTFYDIVTIDKIVMHRWHPWQIAFNTSNPMTHQIISQTNLFALKSFRRGEHDTEAHKRKFENEVSNLRIYGDFDRGIVPLVATIYQGVAYHILLPRADCDLLEYWERYEDPPDNLDSDVQWFAKQATKLAEAMEYIHNPRATNPSSLWHGDIKPDNILVFLGKDTGPNLILGDLGEMTNIATSETMAAGGSYKPPEFEMDKNAVTQSCDIWMLGCLLFEFIVWILQRWKGVEKFKEERWRQQVRPTFFESVKCEGEESESEHIFGINYAVVKKFNSLHNQTDSKCLDSLLNLIGQSMLKIEANERINSSELWGILKAISD